jgi:universal stress protein A
VLQLRRRRYSTDRKNVRAIETADVQASRVPSMKALTRAGMKVETILAPTDLSIESKAGVRYALHAARELDARVVVHYVITTKEIAAFGRSRQEGAFVAAQFNGLLDISELRLRRFLKATYANDLRGVRVKMKVELGSPGKRIVALAKAEAADVIIISGRSGGRITKLFIGSVRERIMRDAPCPVLVIPAKWDSVVSNRSINCTALPRLAASQSS